LHVGYISTIGVIDELRKKGIGNILLEKAINIIKLKKTCIGVFLHVIKYNTSAINFYFKNSFIKGKYLKDFYYINNNNYDAIVFYKLFMNNNHNNEDKNKNIIELN
jgi:ribosomal protein S18 acetylase RimI-like enzyme